MKILTLSIKQKYFDEIVKGTKKNEYREVRPTNSHRYITYSYAGKEYKKYSDIPEDAEEVDVNIIRYDAIKLLTGAYSGKRPYIIVEVVDAVLEYIVDEDGYGIEYEYEGDIYLAAQMNYTLGKILERSDQ